MNDKLNDLREQRLQKLFSDCQEQVLGQIIGPFGLSPAMFEDRNGGNVTTLRNFERNDSDYIATDNDKVLHAQSRKVYGVDVRDDLSIDTKEKARVSGGKTWQEKREEKIRHGRDEYTGGTVAADGTTVVGDGRVVRAELDHVVSIGETHGNKKVHLGLGKVTKDAAGNLVADTSRIREAVNHDDNLALTNQPLNGSKSDKDLAAWSAEKGDGKTSNAERFGINPELQKEKYDKAKNHIDSTAGNALLRKQTGELLETGCKQGAMMGLRQAMGLLLTELVNGLFNEIKILIRQGVEAGKTLFEEIRARLAHVMAGVAKKIPDAVSQMFTGGISGFMSNLLTFLLNHFFSTAKRFVTVIREGIVGLYRAFKMIFYPPEHLTPEEGLQQGLKILGTVIISSVGVLLSETVGTFIATLPFLKPLSDLVTPVLIGVVSGLLSAFLAYQIDCWFDSRRHSFEEQSMDELLKDGDRRDVLASELIALSENSLSNVERFSTSISLYQDTGIALAGASAASAATVTILEATVAGTSEQIRKSDQMIGFINESQQEIDDFLKTL